MDERCRLTHAKLLAGTCPWCGQAILKLQPPPITASSADLIVVRTLSGPSLKELVKRNGPLDYRTAARHIEQVAMQLQEIHDSGTWYRDVRPEHISVDEAGTATLAMLQAAPLDTGTSHSSSDTQEAALACADFLAPEQALSSQPADARADIYSLGCTMYFLLAGQPPFPTGSVSERLLNHQTAKPAAIQSLRSDLPIALAAICEKMMQKNPADRFQRASDVTKAISSWRTANSDD